MLLGGLRAARLRAAQGWLCLLSLRRFFIVC